MLFSFSRMRRYERMGLFLMIAVAVLPSASVSLAQESKGLVFNIGNGPDGESSVQVDGKTYKCKGNLSHVNNVYTCNGVKFGPSDGVDTGPCGDSAAKPHPNGGGLVDVRAKVHPGATVAKGAVICGDVRLGEFTTVLADARLSGTFKGGIGVRIGKGVRLSGDGTLGDNVLIEDGATLSGHFDLKKNVLVQKDATMSGDIVLSGVTVSGDMSCSGDGGISARQMGRGSRPPATDPGTAGPAR